MFPQVCVIVPRSKQIRFFYDCDPRPKKAEALLRQLGDRAPTDPLAKRDLAELCAIMLAEYSSRSMHGSIFDRKVDQERPLVQRLIVAALQADSLSLFDTGVRLLAGTKILPDAFLQLGRLMAVKGGQQTRRR